MNRKVLVTFGGQFIYLKARAHGKSPDPQQLFIESCALSQISFLVYAELDFSLLYRGFCLGFIKTVYVVLCLTLSNKNQYTDYLVIAFCFLTLVLVLQRCHIFSRDNLELGCFLFWYCLLELFLILLNFCWNVSHSSCNYTTRINNMLIVFFLLLRTKFKNKKFTFKNSSLNFLIK